MLYITSIPLHKNNDHGKMYAKISPLDYVLNIISDH